MQRELLPYKGSNLLGKEKSPYLIQHQHNPVWWQPWGDEAIQLARRLDRPIFLSIGYATCHWCHVMERESFENPEVAQVMNEHFVCIKVDREELPDVDTLYMTALHALGQRGGWPLSMWLTPELTPFYGGTYFPPHQFVRLLQQLHQAWVRDRARVQQAGEELSQHLSRMTATVPGEVPLEGQLLQKNLERKKDLFDERWGGFGDAPKFPPSIQLRVLLRTWRRLGDPEALELVEKTLTGMAYGGMYDHLGGGFARYSTDARWLVPHFEKMLYDNALISRAYLECFQVTKKNWYCEVARETLDYVLRDMTSPDGGFYSAEDADSEGVEGKFYVFTPEDLVPVLEPETITRFCEVFGITPRGNFEHGTSILHLKLGTRWEVRNEGPLREARRLLLQARDRRIRPLRDDKILTSWNGLMIDAMAYAYRVMQDPRYLLAAQRAAEFIHSHLWDGKTLLRRYREGDARHVGTLEDYAWLIQGLLGLYEAGRDERWAEWAGELQHLQDQTYFVPERQAYALTPVDQPNLIMRPLELMDGATPNPNGVSAQNLLKLAGLFGRSEWRERACHVLSAGGTLFTKHPEAFGSLLLALDDLLTGGVEVVTAVGQDHAQASAVIAELQQRWTPGVTLAWVSGGDERLPCVQGRGPVGEGPRYYVCRGATCSLPTGELEQVIEEALKR